MHSRSLELTQKYGFQYPEEFFSFWELVAGLDDGPKSLCEKLGLDLVGPFEVLKGRFDGKTPELPFPLHFRYYMDPPEFFTIFCGESDGLHYGYWLDDPAEWPSCVASYYSRDSYELSFDGDTLFDAVRLRLESCYNGTFELIEYDPENTESYEQDFEWMDDFRQKLMQIATRDRPETSDEYVQKYGGSARTQKVVAQTYNGLGIVVPPDLYRPLSLDDAVLWERIRHGVDTERLVEEARESLKAGFPGSALKLGQDLWAMGGDANEQSSYELLDSAYQMLGRPLLQQTLRTHATHRSRTNVDNLG